MFSYISLIWSQNVLQTSESESIGVHLSRIIRPSKNCLRNISFCGTYLFRFLIILQKEQQIRTKNQVLNQLPGVHQDSEIHSINGYPTVISRPPEYQSFTRLQKPCIPNHPFYSNHNKALSICIWHTECPKKFSQTWNVARSSSFSQSLAFKRSFHKLKYRRMSGSSIPLAFRQLQKPYLSE